MQTNVLRSQRLATFLQTIHMRQSWTELS